MERGEKMVIYVSDLDGTLLDDGGWLSPYTAQHLAALIEAGLPFTIATARSWTSAEPRVRALGLRLPVVLYNGALLLDPKSGKRLTAHTLPGDRARGAWERMTRAGVYPFVNAWAQGREQVRYLQGRESPGVRRYLESRRGDPRQQPVADAEALLADEVFYFTAIDSRERLERAAEELARDPALAVNLQEDTYTPGEYWLEVMDARATKAGGLDALREWLGPGWELAVFGDNLNDLPMFRRADAGYAVANAHPRLKAAARQVIGPGNRDGVVRWLEERWRNEGTGTPGK